MRELNTGMTWFLSHPALKEHFSAITNTVCSKTTGTATAMAPHAGSSSPKATVHAFLIFCDDIVNSLRSAHGPSEHYRKAYNEKIHTRQPTEDIAFLGSQEMKVDIPYPVRNGRFFRLYPKWTTYGGNNDIRTTLSINFDNPKSNLSMTCDIWAAVMFRRRGKLPHLDSTLPCQTITTSFLAKLFAST